MKKVVALTLAGAAAIVVAGWRRVQRDNTIEGDVPATFPANPGSSPREATANPVEANPEATKAELYEIAQRLDIEGRSSMTKAELLAAIRAAS